MQISRREFLKRAALAAAGLAAYPLIPSCSPKEEPVRVPQAEYIFSFGVHFDIVDAGRLEEVIIQTQPDLVLSEGGHSTALDAQKLQDAIVAFKERGELPLWGGYWTGQLLVSARRDIPFSYPEEWTEEQSVILQGRFEAVKSKWTDSVEQWLLGRPSQSLETYRQSVDDYAELCRERQDHIAERLNNNIEDVLRKADPDLLQKEKVRILVRMGLLHTRLFDEVSGKKEMWYDSTPGSFGPADDSRKKAIAGREVSEYEIAQSVTHIALDAYFTELGLGGAVARQYAGIFASHIDLKDFNKISKEVAPEPTLENLAYQVKQVLSGKNINYDILPTESSQVLEAIRAHYTAKLGDYTHGPVKVK